ncbi:Ltp family lipoprotein [Staphylococcus succinus]|uniref:Ltp family lipoprotein n=1 Tax=Staphylococcus succinus TaxID=61015 RepID=UPI001C05BDBE|nr:Ltp family lipoprotein [Staphylococcus succinus]MBU0437799.1 Ltp family lipoprotein [Staphylococcus succinus]
MKKVLFLVLASFLALAACGNSEESKSEDKKETKASDKESKTNEESKKTNDDKKEKLDKENTDNNSESNSDSLNEYKKDNNVSREYKNALNSAKNYQSVIPMSKAGLYEQLTSSAGDQYPVEAAQYAINNLEADYKENALKSAKNYQDTMPMSDSELFKQLTSDAGDKYTQEEAKYAIDNIENNQSNQDTNHEDDTDTVTRENVIDFIETYEGETLDTVTYTYKEPEQRDDGSWGFAFYTKDDDLAGSYIVDEDGNVTKYDKNGVEE